MAKNDILANINKSVLSAKLDKAKKVLRDASDPDLIGEVVEILVAGVDRGLIKSLKDFQKEVDTFIKSWYDLEEFEVTVFSDKHEDVFLILERLSNIVDEISVEDVEEVALEKDVDTEETD